MSDPEKAPILMVDDNVDDFVVAEIYYEDSSLTNPFLHIGSGDALLEYYAGILSGEKLKPAFVLLDINMPRMNGFEVLEEIAKLPIDAIPTVVMLTTSAREEDRERALSLGAAAFRMKPMDGAKYVAIFNGLKSYTEA